MKDPAAGDVIATVGAVVSFVKLLDWGLAEFPEESLWLTVIETDPSLAPEKSRLADQAPPEQVTVEEASPVMTTSRPFSEQVPVTVKLDSFAVPTKDPAAGVEIVRVGSPVSLVKVRVDWTAGFPAESVRSA